MTEEDVKVSFRALIEPPNTPPAPPVPTGPEPPPPPVSPDSVIDLTQPDISQLQTSDLLEALPTVLVGIGVAYLVGVASGAWIFSPTID
jgi:hypothetical protein